MYAPGAGTDELEPAARRSWPVAGTDLAGAQVVAAGGGWLPPVSRLREHLVRPGAFVIGINDLPAGRSAEAVSVLDLARLVRELCGSRMPGCIRRGSEIPVNCDDHPPAVLRLRAGALRGTRLCPAGAVTDAAREVAEIYTKASVPLVFRTREQIMQLFGGFELVDPGLVPLPEWRPEPRPYPPGEVWGLAGLGRVES